MCVFYQLDKYIYVTAFFCTLPPSLVALIFFIPRRRRCFSPLLLLRCRLRTIFYQFLLTCYYSNLLGDHRVPKSLDIDSFFIHEVHISTDLFRSLYSDLCLSPVFIDKTYTKHRVLSEYGRDLERIIAAAKSFIES